MTPFVNCAIGVSLQVIESKLESVDAIGVSLQEIEI